MAPRKCWGLRSLTLALHAEGRHLSYSRLSGLCLPLYLSGLCLSHGWLPPLACVSSSARARRDVAPATRARTSAAGSAAHTARDLPTARTWGTAPQLVATLERMDRNTPPQDGLSTLKLTRAASHDHALPCQQQLSSSHASSCLEGGAGRREERREETGRPRGRHPLPTPSPSPPTRPPLLTCDRTHATTHPSPLPQNEAPTSPPPFTHPRLHGKAFSASGSPRFFVVVVDSPSACIPAWPALMWFWARRPSPL